jgi:NAD+ synthase (glutamine-hydrolysing)
MNHYLEELCSYQDIVSRGFDPGIVSWVILAIDSNKYKPRRAAPGLRVTSKIFGMGRRIHIAVRFEI